MFLGQITTAQLARAVAIFLQRAYADGVVPANRKQFCDLSQVDGVDSLVGVSGVEKLPPATPDRPPSFALRIGCAWYQHLKLRLAPYGDGHEYVFTVETHDHFKLPPNSSEEAAVAALKIRNLELAKDIEHAWEAEELPTANSMLRQYVASRKAARQGDAA